MAKKRSTFNVAELDRGNADIETGALFTMLAPEEPVPHPAEKTVTSGLQAARPTEISKHAKSGKLMYNNKEYRGTAYALKHDDPEHLKPQRGKDVHVDVFETWDDKSLKKYAEVSQKVAEGQATISFEEKMPVPEKGGWRILVRWWDNFYQGPQTIPVTRGLR